MKMRLHSLLRLELQLCYKIETLCTTPLNSIIFFGENSNESRQIVFIRHILMVMDVE